MLLNTWGVWRLIRELNPQFQSTMQPLTHAQVVTSNSIAVYAEELCDCNKTDNEHCKKNTNCHISTKVKTFTFL